MGYINTFATCWVKIESIAPDGGRVRHEVEIHFRGGVARRPAHGGSHARLEDTCAGTPPRVPGRIHCVIVNQRLVLNCPTRLTNTDVAGRGQR